MEVLWAESSDADAGQAGKVISLYWPEQAWVSPGAGGWWEREVCILAYTATPASKTEIYGGGWMDE